MSSEGHEQSPARQQSFLRLGGVTWRGPLWSVAAFLGTERWGDPAKLKQHSVERPPPTLATLTKNVASTFAAKRIRCNGILTGWMDTPGECVTQEKFNGRGENRLAKVEVAQPMGRTPAKRSQTLITVLEKALISPLQKAPPELERRASALEKELASLIL